MKKRTMSPVDPNRTMTVPLAKWMPNAEDQSYELREGFKGTGRVLSERVRQIPPGALVKVIEMDREPYYVEVVNPSSCPPLLRPRPRAQKKG